MKYRPFRYDFGLRYVHGDFPAAEQSQLQQILYPSDLNAIKNLLPIIDQKIKNLLQELKA